MTNQVHTRKNQFKYTVVYKLANDDIREAKFYTEDDARLFYEILQPRVEQGFIQAAKLWSDYGLQLIETCGYFGVRK